MREYFASDRRSMTVCLIIAFVAWFLTKMGKEYTHEQSYPLAYQISPDQTFSTQPVSVLNAELRGNGWSFLRLAISGKDDSLFVSVSDNSSQDLSSRLLLSNSLRQVLNDEVEIFTVAPESISLSLVEKESKKVPIVLPDDIPLANQYQLKSDILLEPDSVTVFGAGSQLDSLTSVDIAPLETEGISSDYEAMVPVQIPAEGLMVYPQKVNVVVPIEQITEKEIAVPITMSDSLRESVQIFPDQALVRCIVGLSKFDQIYKQDFVLEAVPDTTHPKGNYKVTLRQAPDFVRSVTYSPQHVEVFLINP